MITYKYCVTDEYQKIQTECFDTFEQAYDYAQNGLMTYITRIPYIDGIEQEDGEEIVWSWDSTHTREDAIANEKRTITPTETFNAEEPTEVEEELSIEVSADEADEIAELAKALFGDNFEYFDQDMPDAITQIDPVEDAPQVEVETEDEEETEDEVANPDDAFEDDLYPELLKKPEDKYSTESEDEDEDEDLEEATHATMAKPEGDRITSYNNALAYANKYGVPFIYGYTNSRYNNKFFALEQPIKCKDAMAAEAAFRNRYKDANVVYVAYPKSIRADHDIKQNAYDRDMTDDEFVEAFGKAMIDKHDSLEEELDDNLNTDRLPEDIEIDGLEVEVEREFGGEPLPDGRSGGDNITYSQTETRYGIIDKYTYTIDADKILECLKKMLNKSELEQSDIDNVDVNDFVEFAKEYFYDEARKELENKVNHDDFDDEDVEWDED